MDLSRRLLNGERARSGLNSQRITGVITSIFRSATLEWSGIGREMSQNKILSVLNVFA
jgi:hypothetical protein